MPPVGNFVRTSYLHGRVERHTRHGWSRVSRWRHHVERKEASHHFQEQNQESAVLLCQASTNPSGAYGAINLDRAVQTQ